MKTAITGILTTQGSIGTSSFFSKAPNLHIHVGLITISQRNGIATPSVAAGFISTEERLAQDVVFSAYAGPLGWKCATLDIQLISFITPLSGGADTVSKIAISVTTSFNFHH
jgi:hypothetical protein